MKIGIYSPYLDTVGGGERYMMTIAETLSYENKVDVFLDSHLQTLDIELIKKKMTNLLNLDLTKINFVKAPFGKGTQFWQRSIFLKSYDLLFYLTDGSVFYSSAKSSILHIQSPIKVANTSLWNKIKQSSWKLILYNSHFTKANSEKYWKIPGEVVHPFVNTTNFKPQKKINQILTVGRFFGYSKDKKHELMINAFIKMYEGKKIKDWSFHLAGGAGEGDLDYVKELEDMAKGYPVYFYPNLEYKKLLSLYGESSIYWHAAGFGEADPTKMEHFGITTIEAMASGCVPVVINLGGQREIVNEKENGLLWDLPQDLERKTLELIEDEKLMMKLSLAAREKSQQFSKDKFIDKINSIVKRYAVS